MVTFRHIKSPYFEGKKSHCRQPYLVAGFLRGKKITCRRHIYSPYFEGEKSHFAILCRHILREKKSHCRQPYVVAFFFGGKKSHMSSSNLVAIF
jgi:hypothetical protein